MSETALEPEHGDAEDRRGGFVRVPAADAIRGPTRTSWWPRQVLAQGRPRRNAVALVALMGFLFGVALPVPTVYRNLYRPRLPIHTTPDRFARGLTYRELELRTFDKLTLAGWWMPALGVDTPKATVVLAHGAGGNRQQMLGKAAFLVRAGYACLLFDFRACGTSQGTMSTLGGFEAADLHLATCTAQARVRLRPVVVFGQSMGASAALVMAPYAPEIAAFVLDSPYATLWEMCREQYRKYPDWLVTPVQHACDLWGRLATGWSMNWVRPQDSLEGLAPRPVLFIHGEEDTVVPPEHSARMHRLYSGPKRLLRVPGAVHVRAHDVLGERYEAAVLAFLADAVNDWERRGNEGLAWTATDRASSARFAGR
ncbi:MAG: alpha/beta fold hydrolase [Candidatus Wallbacteria bacterium]|nr:alpha/beta fold hydrolase [Candidatus Wallbacteria bacterium]